MIASRALIFLSELIQYYHDLLTCSMLIAVVLNCLCLRFVLFSPSALRGGGGNRALNRR